MATTTATEAADLCLCGCCVAVCGFLPRCHIWCESQKGAHNVRSGLTIIVVVVVSADAVGDKSEVDAGSGRSSSPSPSPSSFSPS